MLKIFIFIFHLLSLWHLAQTLLFITRRGSNYALNEKYQEFIKKNGVNEAVLAYRTDLDGKCNIQFAKEIFDAVKRRGQCTAIVLDIKGYFDHTDHKQLKDKWQEIIGGLLPDDQFLIYKRLTRYSYASKNTIFKKYGIKLKKAAVPPETFSRYYTRNNAFFQISAIKR